MPSRQLPALVVLLALGCGRPGPTEGLPGPDPAVEQQVALEEGATEFELGVGETVRLAGHDLAVSLHGVGEDSRCPIDALCVWQGDAAVQLILTTPRGRERATLHTALDPRAIRRAGLVLDVVGVSPAPRSDRRIPEDAYRVRLRAREG